VFNILSIQAFKKAVPGTFTRLENKSKQKIFFGDSSKTLPE
jgi:hypothetical protein